jgi:hypothetical protein
MSMNRKNLYNTAHVSLLVLIPGLAAWLFGRPLIFPSLGPSAFGMVLDEKENRARHVIGGHLIGVISGLVAYHALAHGLTLAALSPALSTGGLRLVLSGVVSITLTAGIMLLTRTVHAPACATTLIVSLGVLPGLTDGILIMVAVIGMVVVHWVITRARKQTTGLRTRSSNISRS